MEKTMIHDINDLMKMVKNSLSLEKSSWPRFRANRQATGKSTHHGPKEGEVVWEKEVGESNGEPAIDLEGNIYLPLKSDELLAIDAGGKEMWRKTFFAHMKKALWGITTPAIRVDGSLITAAFRKVICLELDGSIRWERLIDGVPAAPNISEQGIIYVPAKSVDWIGMYVISPNGEATGKDDPKLFDKKFIPRNNQVSPAAIDSKGHVIVAHSTNITHQEAYSWDPPDEVDEDFSTECVIFDSDGEKLGRIYIEGSGGNSDKLSSPIGDDDEIYYIGFWEKEITIIPSPKLLKEIEMKRKKKKVVKPANWNAYRHDSKFSKGWHSYYDKDGEEGNIYSRRVRGHQAIGKDSRIYVRMTKPWKMKSRRNYSQDNIILQINTLNSTEMPVKTYEYFKDARRKPKVRNEKQEIPDYNILQTEGEIKANPVIDFEDKVYVGTITGNVHVFDINGNELQKININHPVSSLVVGKDESLVVTTDDGYICLIR